MCEVLFIKNMVCPRCITTIESILGKLKIEEYDVQLGRIEINGHYDEALLKKALYNEGFALLKDSASILIEQIKSLMRELYLENNFQSVNTKLSFYLGEKLNTPYHILSKTYKNYENRSIEDYWLALRIEKTKELLEQKNHSLEEIALQVGYSSQQSLSKIFKQKTGLSPREYKNNQKSLRNTLDTI